MSALLELMPVLIESRFTFRNADEFPAVYAKQSVSLCMRNMDKNEGSKDPEGCRGYGI